MDDSISRSDVIDAIDSWYDSGECNMRGNAEAYLKSRIKKLPSVNPAKTGHWIKKEDDTCWWYVCSECEQEPLKNRWNDDDVLSTFCPNCGAKMFESQKSEDKE